jgi:hypothetical protein
VRQLADVAAEKRRSGRFDKRRDAVKANAQKN